MSMSTYSTNQVAKKLKIDQANLQRAIRQKTVPFPPLQQVGALEIRLWSDADVARLRKALAKGRTRRKQ
jgi:hypothetical protein